MASEQEQQERLDRLHVQIGQLFEANVAFSKALENHKAVIAQQNQIIAELRQATTAAASVPETGAPVAPNRAARRAAARGK